MRGEDQTSLASLGTGLMQAITKADLQSTLADLTELLVDARLPDGLLREVPLIRTVMSFAKTGILVRDWLFLRKVQRFLSHMEDVPEAERLDFASRIEADEQFMHRVGENLVLELDRLNDMQKPDMLGRVFKAWLTREIDEPTYGRLASAIDRISMGSLDALRQFYAPTPSSQPDDLALQEWLFCGLVSLVFSEGLSFGPGARHLQNDLGRLFVQIALAPAT